VALREEVLEELAADVVDAHAVGVTNRANRREGKPLILRDRSPRPNGGWKMSSRVAHAVPMVDLVMEGDSWTGNK